VLGVSDGNDAAEKAAAVANRRGCLIIILVIIIAEGRRLLVSAAADFFSSVLVGMSFVLWWWQTLWLPAARGLVGPPIVQKPWIRMVEGVDEAMLETCSRRYDAAGALPSIDLVGVVHVGDGEYFTSLIANETRDTTVLYESVVDGASLTRGETATKLMEAVRATPAARLAARRCGLVAQSDVLGGVAFDRQWHIADVTAEEFEDIIPPKKRGFFFPPLRPPPTTTTSPERVEGAFGAAVARVLCFLAPAPELSLALLEWSRSSSDQRVVDVTSLRAVVCALLLRREAARENLAALALARDLVGAVDRDVEARDGAAVVLARNERVVAAVEDLLLRKKKQQQGEVRVVYGAMHMRDLERRLNRLGYAYVPESERWTRAFGIPLAPTTTDDTTDDDTMATSFFTAPKAVGAPLVLFFALLAVDGLDYVFAALPSLVGFFSSHSSAWELELAELSLYVLRHFALYYALTKFVVA